MSTSPPIRAARGVRDVLPAERAAWTVVERAALESARRYGYQEIEVPVIQPVRLVTIGPMFRHDRPQAGRFRQFYQFDVEVIGDDSAAYDAEVIELTWGWLAGLGLAGVVLELNSIGDANCRPAYVELLQAYYRPLEDQLHPDCRRRLEENPLRLLDCKEAQCQPFQAGAPRITDHLCAPCAVAFAEVKSLLDAAGLEYRLNPFLVRGLDYYTRTVFEFQHDALGGAQNSLGGGGRYDGLPAAPADVLVLPMDAGLDRAAAQVGRRCRQAVPAAVDYSRRSLKAKMRAAD